MTHKPITDAEAESLLEACQRVQAQPDSQINLVAKIWIRHIERLLADRTVAMEIMQAILSYKYHCIPLPREAVCTMPDCPFCKARALCAAVKGGE